VPTILAPSLIDGGHAALCPPYKNYKKLRRNFMPAAFFVVRATVTDPAKRQAFGTWYSREHLPDAMKSFGAVKAWRYWSATDPSLHHAMYQFTDKAALERATEGPEMKRLVADFNRDWPDVTRTREVLVLAEELAA
jgi:hypothetical protein